VKAFSLTSCPLETFKRNLSRMKKEELKHLIEEYLASRKRMENLRKEVKDLEDRYDEILEHIYLFRSKEFLRSALLYLKELKGEYGKDEHFVDLLYSVIGAFKDYKKIEQRKKYTPKHLLYLYDEKVEKEHSS